MNQRDSLIEAMTELDEDRVMELVQGMIDSGATANSIQMALNVGVNNVGKRFEKGDYFIADLIVSGMLYRDALRLLMPLPNNGRSMPVGRVVIGVVEGDIHDIGKDIVVSLLRAEHFEVIDLGVDVKPERFAYAIRTYRPDVLLMSGVLSFAKESMKKTMQLLRSENLRSQVAILIGGMCASENLRALMDVDSWAYDPMETVNFCKKVVGKKYGQEV